MGKRAGRRDGPAGKGQEALPALGLRLFLGPQVGIAVLICLAGAPALGQENYPPVFDNLRENQDVVIGLSLVVGLVLFSTITALLYLRERRRWTRVRAWSRRICCRRARREVTHERNDVSSSAAQGSWT